MKKEEEREPWRLINIEMEKLVAAVNEQGMPPIKASVIGATGEVGSCLVQKLVDCGGIDKVVAISRKPLNITSPKLQVYVLDNFARLETDPNVKMGLDQSQFAFCVLGSTRAKAGSAEAFYKIDHDYSLAYARVAKQAGVRWFGLITSMGVKESASPSWFLYNRTKQEVDRDISALNFDQLYIFRPGLLVCKRKESRWAESLVQKLVPLMEWVAPNRFSIPVGTVAEAMLISALSSFLTSPTDATAQPKKRYLDNQEMVKLSKQYTESPA